MPSLSLHTLTGSAGSGLSGPKSAVRTPSEAPKRCWSRPTRGVTALPRATGLPTSPGRTRETETEDSMASDGKPWQRDLLPALLEHSPQAAITLLQIRIQLRGSPLPSCHKIRNLQERIKKKGPGGINFAIKGQFHFFQVFSPSEHYLLWGPRDVRVLSDNFYKTMKIRTPWLVKSAGIIAKPQKHTDRVLSAPNYTSQYRISGNFESASDVNTAAPYSAAIKTDIPRSSSSTCILTNASYLPKFVSTHSTTSLNKESLTGEQLVSPCTANFIIYKLAWSVRSLSS